EGVAPELLDREVVEADGAYVAFNEELGCVGAQIGEALLEAAVGPQRRVVGLEEEDLAAGDVVRLERGAVDDRAAAQVQHAAIPHHAIEPDLLERRRAVDEVCRSV